MKVSLLLSLEVTERPTAPSAVLVIVVFGGVFRFQGMITGGVT